jgi:hypothetical protein
MVAVDDGMYPRGPDQVPLELTRPSRAYRRHAYVRLALCEHDRQVRTAHLAAARTLSPRSERYLRGLAAILHYADHREADLEDAAGALQNVLAIALADRSPGKSDSERVLAAADVALNVLHDIHREAHLVELGALAGKLHATSFKAMLEPLRIKPHEMDLVSCLNAIGSSISNATDGLVGPLPDRRRRRRDRRAVPGRGGDHRLRGLCRPARVNRPPERRQGLRPGLPRRYPASRWRESGAV